MRIGIDIRSLAGLPQTGVGMYTSELLRALFATHGEHEYVLYSNEFGSTTYHLPEHDGLKIETVQTHIPNKFFHTLSLTGIIPAIDEVIFRRTGKSLDYFFSPNINSTPLSSRVRHIQTIHDLSFVHLKECYTAKQRLWHALARPRTLCLKAYAVVVPSESTQSDVIETFDVAPERVHVIAPGISEAFRGTVAATLTPEQAQAIRDRYTLPKKYILGFGTLEPRKNWQGLVDAFTMLRPDFPDTELVLAGASGWKNNRLREQIAKTPGVRYIGEVSEEDKASIYRLAAAFVYPSLFEGFGFPVLEAALCRVPIVTSNRTSLPHLIPGAVVTVNPLNAADIASGIRRALGDSAWRASAVPRACELTAAYHFTHTAQALAKLFVSSV